ncbi:MAG: putative quinol monooxygenase [Spirochaetia bacterium]|jgi:quinol monooxygenase YgiN
MMVAIIATVYGKPTTAVKLGEALKELGRETKKEKGNLCFHMHTKEDDSSTFIFYENYASEEAFATHLGSPHAKKFGDVFTAQKLGRAETTIVRLSKVEL